MCNAQSLECYVWPELTTSLFKGLDTDLCLVIIQFLIFQDWHYWYFLMLSPISGLLVWLQLCCVGSECSCFALGLCSTNSLCSAQHCHELPWRADLSRPSVSPVGGWQEVIWTENKGSNSYLKSKQSRECAIWEPVLSALSSAALAHHTWGNFLLVGRKVPSRVAKPVAVSEERKRGGRIHPPLPNALEFISWASLQCVGEKLAAQILPRNGLFNKHSVDLFIYKYSWSVIKEGSSFLCCLVLTSRLGAARDEWLHPSVPNRQLCSWSKQQD